MLWASVYHSQSLFITDLRHHWCLIRMCTVHVFDCLYICTEIPELISWNQPSVDVFALLSVWSSLCLRGSAAQWWKCPQTVLCQRSRRDYTFVTSSWASSTVSTSHRTRSASEPVKHTVFISIVAPNTLVLRQALHIPFLNLCSLWHWKCQSRIIWTSVGSGSIPPAPFMWKNKVFWTVYFHAPGAWLQTSVELLCSETHFLNRVLICCTRSISLGRKPND